MNISYEMRVDHTVNLVGKKLFRLMAEKQTNIGFSADIVQCQPLLNLLDEVGPHIALVKTHIDILEDFTPEFAQKLQKLAEKHRFLIFEDRKFSELGDVVTLQYGKGLYHIVEWADLVNTHALPGSKVIENLQKAVGDHERGLLVIAEMSSSGVLSDESYIREAIRWAEAYPNFVCGFICSRRLSFLPGVIHVTPGIHRCTVGDAEFQSYITPSMAIKQKQTDIILVGKGIYAATDPLKEVMYYRKEGWNAYKDLLKNY
ncbi:Orotidine 5'-phosphate decarboxylase [Candidatus Clavichlamydia salmonicola]|uniref:orotidine-5'-phosphate decarboxylase n=1 Tax=Candidatus Clavichlamydia salmonicola TaxID=469812 RepID=UPI001890DC3F|nr:orotidine-5'-phosphate decarboxylase [Candidatus Clavichlamydia salmonicola]MBF5050989.1 Orotidine 5'-phosphate decarboxylase [Candidatus Clavichlamydia salmonicola]